MAENEVSFIQHIADRAKQARSEADSGKFSNAILRILQGVTAPVEQQPQVQMGKNVSDTYTIAPSEDQGPRKVSDSNTEIPSFRVSPTHTGAVTARSPSPCVTRMK